jgi:hypothetical protein
MRAAIPAIVGSLALAVSAHATPKSAVIQLGTSPPFELVRDGLD